METPDVNKIAQYYAAIPEEISADLSNFIPWIQEPAPALSAYSTVADFARLRGLSTSQPQATSLW